MTYSSEVLADTPLAYHRLGETATPIQNTTAADSSGNGRDGTYIGSGWSHVTGLLVGDSDGAANTASGNMVSVTYGSWMTALNITGEAVIKPSIITGTRTILARWTGSAGLVFWQNGASLELLVSTAAGIKTLTGPATLTIGTTCHAAFTYDGTTAVIYQDGVAVASATWSSALTTTTANMTFAGFPNTAYYIGTLDEVAYYGTALSATRIAAHYAAATAAPAATVDATASSSGQSHASATASLDISATAAASGVSSATAQIIAGDVVSATAAASGVSSATAAASLVGQIAATAAGSGISDAAAVATTSRRVIESDDNYANDGYNYTGDALVDYEPPVVEPPAHLHRTKVNRVHPDMPPPELDNGRPV